MAKHIQEFRLSPQQQRICSLQKEHGFYRAVCSVEISGPLHTETLQVAIQTLVNSHDILRTTYHQLTDGTSLTQHIHDECQILLNVINMQAYSSQEQKAQIEQFYHLEKNLPVDLTQKPLVRLFLIVLSRNKHILFLSLPSLCADSHSLKSLVCAISETYRLCLQGEQALHQSVQYVQFSEWEWELREDQEAMKIGQAYWQKQKREISFPLHLLTHTPSPQDTPPAFADLECHLAEEMIAGIHRVIQRYGISLDSFMLICWQVLLWRLTNQQGIVIGVSCNGRKYEELRDAVGCYATWVPVLTHFQENSRFCDVLEQLHQTLESAYTWQEYFPIVHKEETATKVFSSAFEMEEWPLPFITDDLSFAMQEQYTLIEPYDVKLRCIRQGKSLRVVFSYDKIHFSQETIQLLTSLFKTVLQYVIASPETPVSKIELLPPDEQRKILFEWNRTLVDYPDHQGIHQLFEEQVSYTPEWVALLYQDEQFTYAELNARANQLAHYLRTFHVGNETLVAVCFERSTEMIIGILGVLKAGAAYIPLDPSFPAERIAFIVEDAQASVLLTQHHLRMLFPREHAHTIYLDVDRELLAQQSKANPVSLPTPDHLAYVIYTSGSTGRPKGVQISHRTVVNFLLSMQQQLGVSADDVVLALTTLSFDIAALEIFLPLTRGTRLIVASHEDAANATELIELLERFHVTVMQATPPTWRMLLSTGWQGNRELKILCGGETLPLELARHLLSKGSSLWNMYGPTETTIWSTLCKIERGDDRVSIGRPIANTHLYILDAYLQPVPIGVPGELYIGGIGLARGYLKRPDVTAERFLPHPFSTKAGARLYKTGDLARYRADGTIEHLGRLDHQVKVRGFRIELGEIEAILAQHPGVSEVVVLAREHGLEGLRLIAYLVPRRKFHLSVDELRHHLQRLVPDYMIPSAFVFLDHLPLTPNGKIDRLALPSPAETRPELEGAYVAAKTPLEETLVTIWSQVLRVEQIGVHDNFFSLGGDSILGVQVVARASQQGIKLVPKQLFQYQTIAQLASAVAPFAEQQNRETGSIANRLSHPARSATPSIPPITLRQQQREKLEKQGWQIEDAYPLSPLQQGLLFHSLYAPHSEMYFEQLSCVFHRSLHVTAFIQAWQQIIDHYPVLRTQFLWNDLKEPIQVVLRHVEFSVEQQDWRGITQEEQQDNLEVYLREDRKRDFHLSHAPLLRLALLRRTEESYYFVWSHHHLLLDGWSISLLLRDVLHLYETLCQGESIALEHAPPYRNYIYWLRQQDLSQAELFWRKTLRGFTTPTRLGIDHISTEIQTDAYEEQYAQLSATTTTALQSFARQQHITMNTLIQGAWAILLSRYSGEKDVLFGTTVSGRSASLDGVDSIVGLFINTLPVRVQISAYASLIPWLKTLQDRQVEIQQYEYNSLVHIQGWSEVPQNLSLFETLLVFENYPVDSSVLRWDTYLYVTDVHFAERTNYPLTIVVSPGATLSVRASYALERFATTAITRLLGHFTSLLEAMVTYPDSSLSALPLLTAAEQRQLLVEWNATRQEEAGEQSLHALFEAQVKRTPHATALVFGDQQLTYSELEQRANQLAHSLQRMQVGPEVRVGLYLHRSTDLIVGLLGILKAGGAYVPLDPAYPKARLAFMLEDAHIAVLLTHAHLLESCPAQNMPLLCLDTDWGVIAHESTEPSISAVSSLNLAYVIYTSGSTGTPKGVMIAHRGLVNYVRWSAQAYAITRGQGVPLHSSIGFDLTITSLLTPLIAGQQVVLLSETQEIEPLRIALQQHADWSLLKVTPTHLDLLNRLLPVDAMASATHCLLVGGEALFSQSIASWREHAPHTRIVNEYGPTETVVGCCTYTVGSRQTPGAIPIGRPIANTDLYVLDAQLHLVPIGVAGELYIGGAGLARGYLNSPEKTAERFIPHPFSQEPGQRLYKTGDLVRYLEDGELDYLGRVDRQVKVRGYRIELEEIEAALTQHPSVQDALVVLQGTTSEEKHLIAYLVALGEQPLQRQELRRLLQRFLPDYMLPTTFLQVESLSLTSHGKRDRGNLPNLNSSIIDSYTTFAPPQGALEERIAHVWREVLHVDKVGRDDNFFDLGGHSLLILRVQSQLRNMSGSDVTIVDLFTYPTVSTLAEFMLQKDQDVDIMQNSFNQAKKRTESLQRQRETRSMRQAKQKGGRSE